MAAHRRGQLLATPHYKPIYSARNEIAYSSSLKLRSCCKRKHWQVAISTHFAERNPVSVVKPPVERDVRVGVRYELANLAIAKVLYLERVLLFERIQRRL